MKQNTQNGTYITIRIDNLQIKQKHTKHTTIYKMLKIEPKECERM